MIAVINIQGCLYSYSVIWTLRRQVAAEKTPVRNQTPDWPHAHTHMHKINYRRVLNNTGLVHYSNRLRVSDAAEAVY